MLSVFDKYTPKKNEIDTFKQLQFLIIKDIRHIK